MNATTPTADLNTRVTVTIPEACRISGLGRSFLYELMANDKLRSVKVGNRRLIHVDSLRALLNAA